MINLTRQDKTFLVINKIFILAILFVIIYPLYFVIIASISDPILVSGGKVWLFPKGITFEGYIRVFRDEEIWIGYRNTILYTIVGTTLNVIMTILCAYPLSRKDFVGRNFFTAIYVFTMFFSGGLVPTFLLIKNLNLINKFWVMILPSAISIYNVIITRTYFQASIPVTLQEAAHIDGASNTRLLIKIILPLSAPIISVIALYYGIGHWNSYFGALIYIRDVSLKPLQLFLREILVQQQMSTAMMEDAAGDPETFAVQAKISEIIKYAVIIVSTIPVMIIYPFLQKFFIKGVMVGALKG